MGRIKNGGDWENNTRSNPYDNYHGHQQSGQSLQNSDTNEDPNITGKDPKNKKHKNK